MIIPRDYSLSVAEAEIHELVHGFMFKSGAPSDLSWIVLEYLGAPRRPEICRIFLREVLSGPQAIHAEGIDLTKRVIREIRSSIFGNEFLKEALEHEDAPFLALIEDSDCPLDIGDILYPYVRAGNFRNAKTLLMCRRAEEIRSTDLTLAIEYLAVRNFNNEGAEVMDLMLLQNADAPDRWFNGASLAITSAREARNRRFFEYLRDSAAARSCLSEVELHVALRFLAPAQQAAAPQPQECCTLL